MTSAQLQQGDLNNGRPMSRRFGSATFERAFFRLPAIPGGLVFCDRERAVPAGTLMGPGDIAPDDIGQVTSARLHLIAFELKWKHALAS
jgi:hypothetical protein